MNMDQKIIQFNFPTIIRYGNGSIKEVPSYLKEMGKKKALIVSDQGMLNLDFFEKFLDDLKKEKIEPKVFSSIDKNPTENNVLLGKSSYINGNCDCILGFGGGASMDVARAIALLINHDRPLFDFDDAQGGDRYVQNEIPLFIVALDARFQRLVETRNDV